MMMAAGVDYEDQLESNAFVIEPLDTLPPLKGVVTDAANYVNKMATLFSQDTQQAFAQKNAMFSHIKSNTASQNYLIDPVPLPKKKSHYRSRGRPKLHAQRKFDFDAEVVTPLLLSRQAQDEVLNYEKTQETKNLATSELNTLFNELRPAIEEHERATRKASQQA